MGRLNNVVADVTNTATNTAKYNLQNEFRMYKPQIIKYILLGGILFSTITALIVSFLVYLIYNNSPTQNMTFMYNDKNVVVNELRVDIAKKEVNAVLSGESLEDDKDFMDFLKEMLNKFKKTETESVFITNQATITAEIIAFLEQSSIFPEDYRVLVEIEWFCKNKKSSLIWAIYTPKLKKEIIEFINANGDKILNCEKFDK